MVAMKGKKGAVTMVAKKVEKKAEKKVAMTAVKKVAWRDLKMVV